jgi:hypothetical protein
VEQVRVGKQVTDQQSDNNAVKAFAEWEERKVASEVEKGNKERKRDKGRTYLRNGGKCLSDSRICRLTPKGQYPSSKSNHSTTDTLSSMQLSLLKEVSFDVLFRAKPIPNEAIN